MEFINNFSLWKRFLHDNGYVIRHSIGHGGFGDVFSAVSSTDGIEYAVKRLVSRRNIMADASAVGEIEALMGLDHPRVIGMKEVLLCPRMACIVMELASNGNLEMFVQNAALSDAFVVKTFRQLTCAIEFCHSCGIAHRDINPSNVLVFATGDVKIADFGLCFRCRDEGSGKDLLCSDYLGQEAYIAPEVKAQKPYMALPADIWSLGCVLSSIVSSGHADTDKTLDVNSNANSDANIPCQIPPEANCQGPATGQSSGNSHTTPTDIFYSKEFLCFAAQLKRHRPSERPSVTEVLQRWTKLAVDVVK